VQEDALLGAVGDDTTYPCRKHVKTHNRRAPNGTIAVAVWFGAKLFATDCHIRKRGSSSVGSKNQPGCVLVLR